MKRSYWELPLGYKELPAGYKGLIGATRGDKRLQGVGRGYRGL